MWNRIVQLLRKELIIALRDPKMRLMLFVPPILQLTIFGYAVNVDVELTRLVWVDPISSPLSRSLAEEFEGSPFFEISHRVGSSQEAQRLLETGRAAAIIQVPESFEANLFSRTPSSLQLILDGADSNSAAVVSGYVNGVLGSFQRRLTERRQQQPGARVGLRNRIWFNPQLESRVYFVPGVIANIVGLITIMLTSMAIVREKEIGTLEQLMVTPLRPFELMLGKTLPFALLGMIEMVLATSAALLIFEVPFHGHPLTLLAAGLIFVVTSLGIGLLISTLSQTQQQAMMGAFFFFLPSFLLSGFAFPIRNMPELIQWITLLNPMRYFLEIVRGIFLQGLGFGPLAWQFGCLAALGVAVISFSSLRFQKRLD